MNNLRVDKLEEYQCPYVERHCLGDKCVAWSYHGFSKWIGVNSVYTKLEEESRPKYKAWFSGVIKYRDEGFLEEYYRKEGVMDKLYENYTKDPTQFDFVKIGYCNGNIR